MRKKPFGYVVARDMVNAKELVKHFEETRARGSNQYIYINVGIDEDINLL